MACIEPGHKTFHPFGTYLQSTQGNTHGSRHANGRGSANDQVFDSTDHRAIFLTHHVLFLHGEFTLVDHDNAVIFPCNCFGHTFHAVSLSRKKAEFWSTGVLE